MSRSSRRVRRPRPSTRVVPQLVSDGVAGRITVAGPVALGSGGRRRGREAPRLDRGRRDLRRAGRRHPGPARRAARRRASTTSCSAAWAARRSLPRSSPAPTASRSTVLDATDPGQVRAALDDRLEQTAVVISSKSGSTVETDSQKRVYEAAFRDAGIDPTERIVVVTDPGSPLDVAARADGYRVFNADPERRRPVLGADRVRPRADRARRRRHPASCSTRPRPCSSSSRSTTTTTPASCSAPRSPAPSRSRTSSASSPTARTSSGFADWAEQLIAESTGKDGKGLLPVVLDVDSPELVAEPARPADRAARRRRARDRTRSPRARSRSPDRSAARCWSGSTRRRSPGASWASTRSTSPTSSRPRSRTRGLLDDRARADRRPPSPTDGIEVRAAGSPDARRSHRSTAAVDALLAAAARRRLRRGPGLPRPRRPSRARRAARRCSPRAPKRPVTFGWGPRFLHSTGQFHKGGPAVGVFLQIVAAGDDGSRDPRPPVHLRPADPGPGRRRRERARRPRPPGAHAHRRPTSPRGARAPLRAAHRARSVMPVEITADVQPAAVAVGSASQPHRRAERARSSSA